jgi:hypothetical protein
MVVHSPGVKRDRGVMLTAYPYAVSRSRTSRSYTSSPPKSRRGVERDSFNVVCFVRFRIDTGSRFKVYFHWISDTFRALVYRAHWAQFRFWFGQSHFWQVFLCGLFYFPGNYQFLSCLFEFTVLI